ncbi:MAG: hypothetical protein EXX96DRAFT_645701 [Benjaminiella poitrasii]|nr:MAG: hypothetical protein EXX96DRAFT_645701 [Benjaminiella poitrasii]
MPFIENIVPSLLSLLKITGFVEFKWSETEFTSNKYLELSEHGYRSSSGKLKENTGHSIDDSLKLLEYGVFSLRKEAILNKNSSIASFKKLKVFWNPGDPEPNHPF